MPKSYTFSHAICRQPSSSIINGLRAVDTGAPDLELFEKNHSDYISALKSTGAKVTVLNAMDAYPDSVFVEDAALCLPELAILMRPGAPTRLGEAKEMAPHLSAHYSTVRTIEGPGFIEGGDILVTEREILVGKSARTNSAGVAELKSLVAEYGHKLREVQTPPDVLHFKTDCSLLDEETILSTKRLAQTGCFKGYRVLYTEDGEEASANSIRFNDLLIIPNGFDKTAETLDKAGYKICQIGNSEAAKLDGGMSCLSLRFSPS
ncbi:MAG: dimethylarginine dimethylaminohydrolase [Lentilitoribacter sp.]